MMAQIGEPFSIAPLSPVAPGKPVHSVEVPWDGAWGMLATVSALEAFYGANVDAFLDWLAELYWRSRENVMPKRPKDTRAMMACGVRPEHSNGNGATAPLAAAWLLELIFTTGDERPEFLGALGVITGPVTEVAVLRKMAEELGHFTAWLHYHGMEVAYRKAEDHQRRTVGITVGQLSAEAEREHDERQE
jgi:hypothetical protein